MILFRLTPQGRNLNQTMTIPKPVVIFLLTRGKFRLPAVSRTVRAAQALNMRKTARPEPDLRLCDARRAGLPRPLHGRQADRAVLQEQEGGSMNREMTERSAQNKRLIIAAEWRE